MPDLSFIGSASYYHSLSFDSGWSSLEIHKGDDTNIFFTAKTAGANILLDDNGFQIYNVSLVGALLIFLVSDPDDPTTVLLTKTNMSTGGVKTIDALGGKMIITIGRDDLSSLPAGMYLCVLAMQAYENNVQVVSINEPDNANGYFRLSFQGQTTVPVQYPPSVLGLRNALEALTTIGVGNVLVEGGPLPHTMTITFRNGMSNSQQGDIVPDNTLMASGEIRVINTNGANSPFVHTLMKTTMNVYDSPVASVIWP